jgi:hypothetical protein
VFAHGGPYFRASCIGNTGVCIHRQCVPGPSKLGTCLVPDGFNNIDSLTVPRLCRHLCPRRILALPLFGASLRPRFLCSFLDIYNLDIGIVDLDYLKHNFLDHDNRYSNLTLGYLDISTKG